MNNDIFFRLFLYLGIIFILIAFLIKFNVFSFFGKLPLDFKYESDNVKIYFPFGSSIVISIILTIIFYFISIIKK